MEQQEHNIAPQDGVEEKQVDASRRERLKERRFAANILVYLHDLVYLLSVVMILFLVVFRIVVVSGPSMYDTLVDGDYLLLVGKVLYNNPQPGDIIVASKESFEDGMPIVKRVIAVEGQEVDIDFTEGIVYVDGEALQEDYTYTLTTMQEGMEFPLVVDEGCVFVMGDNRNSSRDSRYPGIGLIDEREILGKAILLFIPGTHYDELPRDFSRVGALS